MSNDLTHSPPQSCRRQGYFCCSRDTLLINLVVVSTLTSQWHRHGTTWHDTTRHDTQAGKRSVPKTDWPGTLVRTPKSMSAWISECRRHRMLPSLACDRLSRRDKERKTVYACIDCGGWPFFFFFFAPSLFSFSFALCPGRCGFT